MRFLCCSYQNILSVSSTLVSLDWYISLWRCSPSSCACLRVLFRNCHKCLKVLSLNSKDRTNLIELPTACQDSTPRPQFFNHDDLKKSAWTAAMAKPGRPKKCNNSSPRSLYVREVASPLNDGLGKTPQSGGMNCSDNAMTWNRSEGKYRNSIESCVGFRYLTGSVVSLGGQRENRSLKYNRSRIK